jgi:hypothetical protein
MGGALMGLLHEFAVVAAALPVELTCYCVAVAALLVLFLLCVRSGQFARAFWCVILMLVVDFLFSSGEDTSHHVYRIVALTAQLRHGGIDLLLTNPATGEVFPVFVYYSFVPYILPVLLHIAGCAPLVAFKIAMALQLLVFAAGLQALLTKIPLTQEPHASRAGYLLCILLVTATYVDGLWWTRAALGEVWVYSLAPWVVYAILSPCRPRLLFMLLFVQICAHPIVFIHSLVAEFVVAFGVSSLSLVTVLRRTVAPLAIALAVGSPYWLPQFLWIHDVLGNSAIPIKFGDTFLYAADIISPLRPRNLGICLPLAVATMIGAARERLPLRAWVLVASCAALLALQHARLRGITTHVPVLDLSQDVWRLMFPTAFVAFAALVAGWRALSTPATRVLCILTVLAPFSLLLFHAITWLDNPKLWAHVRYDDAGYADYLRAGNLWGVAPFAPNYAELPQNCDAALSGETLSASFRQLRTGVRADSGVVSVKGAPIGFVDYKVNGVLIHPYACRDALLFGPLTPNSILFVSESKLDYLVYLRVLILILGLAGSLRLMQLAEFLRRRVSSSG